MSFAGVLLVGCWWVAGGVVVVVGCWCVGVLLVGLAGWWCVVCERVAGRLLVVAGGLLVAWCCFGSLLLGCWWVGDLSLAGGMLVRGWWVAGGLLMDC